MRGAALGLLLAAPAVAQEVAATCVWDRVAPAGAYDGPCTFEATARGIRVEFGTRGFDVVERDGRGPWADVTLNGVEAMRFSPDPSRHVHATLDLNEMLEVTAQ